VIAKPVAKDPTKSKTGRPRNEIDWVMFENLCGIHCTQSEIANFLKVHVDTLRDCASKKYEEEFSTVYKRLADNGKCSLRRYQFALAKKNTTMAIWLGKQWLGQKDDPSEAFQQTNQLVHTLLDEIRQMKQDRLSDQRQLRIVPGVTAEMCGPKD
jgi:hypothetical protein